MDFLWHKVSEEEKQEIKEQAKSILGNFSKKLVKINKEITEPLIERFKFERVEGSSKCEEIDREIMFENAPEKNKDFILAERKKW